MKKAVAIFNALNLFFSLAAIGSLVWFHGFSFQPEYIRGHLFFLHFCFGFFILQFAFRAWIYGDLKEYLKRNRIEYLIFIGLVLGMLTNWLLDFSVARWLLSFTGIENSEYLFLLHLHIWLLMIVGLELGRAANQSTIWKLSPSLLFILSFLVLIVIGSSLLMLPEMTLDGQGLSVVDALFTSVSANCVTGLAVVDTATTFSIKGQIILLVFIQLGGLNIIFFATFFISRFHKVIRGQEEDAAIREFLHTSSLQGDTAPKLLWRVVLTSLLIEFVGMLVIYNQWGEHVVFVDQSQKIFFSVFHAVSAFNNAGFSLFEGGLTNDVVTHQYTLHLAMAALIIIGGIGYTTIWDIRRIGSLFQSKRSSSPFRLDTRVSVVSALVLVVLGALIFYFLEKDGALAGLGPGASASTAFFQSVTARTAGFNTISLENLGIAALVLLMLLMLIGASSGSTGGGVKTSTVAVLLLAAVRGLGKKKAKADARLLTIELTRKASLILLYSLFTILIGSCLLLVSESDMGYTDLLFEEVSAFGTVGLSTGITKELSSTGKSIIMITMLIGRVGPLALAYTLIKTKRFRARTDAKGFMIG